MYTCPLALYVEVALYGYAHSDHHNRIFQRFETLLLLLPAVYVGYRSYKRAGVTIKSEQLALRSGWLTIKSIYVKTSYSVVNDLAKSYATSARIMYSTCDCHARHTHKVVDVGEHEAQTIYEWFLRKKK